MFKSERNCQKTIRRKLRREYHIEIPDKLSGKINELERKILMARLNNIRNLLERGYGFAFKTKEDALRENQRLGG
jgi:hypothetical protein